MLEKILTCILLIAVWIIVGILTKKILDRSTIAGIVFSIFILLLLMLPTLSVLKAWMNCAR